jgi:hypothetical protein
MTKTKKIVFSSIAFLIVCLLNLTSSSFAQSTSAPKNQIEPSYEVVLQTLIASNLSTNKSDIPQTLSGVVRKLIADYSYSNFRLGSTFLQRVSNNGAVELRSVSNEPISNPERNYTVFSELTLNDLQNFSDAKGRNSIKFSNLRFGQRIPIVMTTIKDDSGKSNPVVNYEQIGLTLQRFSLAENTPTIVGSLSTTKPDELMFLVLTVRPTQ